MESARVQKFIAQSGYCSRRKAEELIKKGHVTVNGEVVELGAQCTEEDEIKVAGRKIKSKINFVYYVMNKSKGTLCANEDKLKSKLVFDLLKDEDKRKGLFTVGRLDKFTTGLLIITNDGDFSQKVIHPSSKIKKSYLVTLNKKLREDDQKTLERGIELDDKKLAPLKIVKIGKQYQVEIWEGRKRQIRRMFEARGYLVTKLHREAIGKLRMDDFVLDHGQYTSVPKSMLEKKIF